MKASKMSNPEAFAEQFEAVVSNVGRVVKGNLASVRLAVVTMVAEGHLLIEDVPGVGKTTLAKALAASVSCEWRRIQFTPDLLPSDVTGVTVFNRELGTFEFRPGGIFANIVLGDEINRASPKTQAALLEAMEEGQVTVDATSRSLPRPFMVIATQNPVDRQGTYPLPDSQLDRFLMRLSLGYPDVDAEMAILDAHGTGEAIVEELDPVATGADIEELIAAARAVHVARSLKKYLLELAAATRSHPELALGMSPRSVLALLRACRANAAAGGRAYVVPDDVKLLAGPVLAHRLVTNAAARVAGITAGDVLDEVVDSIPVPVPVG